MMYEAEVEQTTAKGKTSIRTGLSVGEESPLGLLFSQGAKQIAVRYKDNEQWVWTRTDKETT